MDYEAPNHYSYKFKFNIDKLPAYKKDRLSPRLSLCGILFAIFFIVLGIFEFISITFYTNFDDYKPESSLINFTAQELMIERYIFDAIILLLGISVLTISVLAMRRYKSIFFDGENIKIIHKPLFGEERDEKEKLSNYLGVLLRIEYYQLGLINRNRYIIELYHKEKNKRIPLYISTSSHNLRKIWENYAEKLKKPALFMTDHGLISRHYEELNKTLKEMAQKWQLKALYKNEEDIPNTIKCTRKKEYTIIEEKRLFFDAYAILALFGLIILGSLITCASMNVSYITPYIGNKGFSAFLTLCVIIFLLSAIILFRRSILIITENSVVLRHNLGFIRINSEVLEKDKIEAVDIGHNPTTDRYYLSIISDEKNIIFGKNMPMYDLRWIRGLVIRDIIK